MVSPLRTRQLLEQVLRSVQESGWQALIFDGHKPFHLRFFRDDERGFDVVIYIWNCTHGGGAARARNEYRVQVTGVVPTIMPGQTTLLLGWHSGYGVFVGFDIRRHNQQDSQSPSIQVREETLQAAHTQAFAIHYRGNGEIAVAFRPEFFVEYALNAETLHSTGQTTDDLTLLNNLGALSDTVISEVQNQERRVVISQIARRYRATDFRRRVVGAYGHRCAMCGVQLELIDAAHIIPVASDRSTDETRNGISLCKLHHAAMDQNLVSFDERYRVEVSPAEVARLRAANLVGGLAEFEQSLRTAIILPNDRRDYPPPDYISESRVIRRWGLGG